MNTSLAPLFRRSVGFDRFDELFDDVLRSEVASTYPPYDIVRESNDSYRLVMAVAGFAEKDLSIVAQGGKLTVSGNWPKDEENRQQGRQWLHRGIARRAFERSFRLADHVEVKAARLRDGLLEVELVQVVPEAQRPRQINISH